jgi:acyl-CoA thioesterase YciA
VPDRNGKIFYTSITSLSHISKVSGIAAKRFAHSEVMTVGIESIRFMRPMPQGSFIDINAEVVHVGNTSMKIKITVMMDQDPEEEQVQTAEAFFTFVAVDENGKPHKVGRTL